MTRSDDVQLPKLLHLREYPGGWIMTDSLKETREVLSRAIRKLAQGITDGEQLIPSPETSDASDGSGSRGVGFKDATGQDDSAASPVGPA